jgi:curved DNA-binding protein CbpA
MKNKTRSECYAVLGLTEDATMDQARTAFRKLAKKYHPDVNPSNDSARLFQEMQAAYEQISSGTFSAFSQRAEGDKTQTPEAH